MTKYGTERPLHPRWTVRDALSRVWEIVRNEGLKSLWFKVLGEICYRRLVLLEYDLSPQVHKVHLDSPVEIALLSMDEVDEYFAGRPQADPADIRRRFAHGEHCFVARFKGEMVGACWAATGRAFIEYLDCEISLAPDQVYVYNAFTVAQFRGRRIAPQRGLYLAQYMEKAGYRRLVGAVMPENKAAFRAPTKVGARHVGWLRRWQLGSWRHYSLKVYPGATAFHIIEEKTEATATPAAPPVESPSKPVE
jgi:hypothetical protein